MSWRSSATSSRARRLRAALIVASLAAAALLIAAALELRREFSGAAVLRTEVAASYDARDRIQSVFSLL